MKWFSDVPPNFGLKKCIVHRWKEQGVEKYCTTFHIGSTRWTWIPAPYLDGGFNNNNNGTSVTLKPSVTRSQKRNKTKSLIIVKSRGRTGVIISLRWKSDFEEKIRFDIFRERGKTFTRCQCRWECAAGVSISLRGRQLFKVEKQFWKDTFWDF